MHKYQDIKLIKSVSNSLIINILGETMMVASLSVNKAIQSVKISVYLQRYENNTWVTVEHWSHECDGAKGHWSNSRYVVSGYMYRLKTYFYAYDGSSNECIIRTTPGQYY